MTNAPVLSLEAGVPAEVLQKTMGISYGLFLLALVIGILVEMFRGSPGRPKDYGGVAWRAIIVFALLKSYPMVLGSIVSTAQGIADAIAPVSVYRDWSVRILDSMSKAAPSKASGIAGGMVFDALTALLVLVGQGFYWAFSQLTQILIALLYVVGPLAVVFHVTGADSLGKWFRHFVTVSTWPIFSALLLRIASSIFARSEGAFADYASAFSAVGATLLMVAMCLATPYLAAAMVGGAISNLPMAALSTAASGAGSMVRRVAGGADVLSSALEKIKDKSAGASHVRAASELRGAAVSVGPSAAPPRTVDRSTQASPPDEAVVRFAPISEPPSPPSSSESALKGPVS